jgi:hypothetical protein
VLVLAAANAVSVLLFGTLYAAAGTGHLTGPSFLACLPVLFALTTSLWVRTERRHRALPPIRRLGRAVVGLVGVLVVTPMAVLTPLFWLELQLPAEAGLHLILGPTMALVLIALVLTILVNAVGGVVIGVRAALGACRRAGRP